MLSTSRNARHIDSQITADNYTFETVREFVNLSSAITTINDVSLEIKCRITLANKCCSDLNGQLSNRDLSRTTEIIFYNILLLYDEKALTLLSTDATSL